MIWLLQNWRIILGIALAGVIFAGGWMAGSSSTQKRWDSETLIHIQEQLAATERNQALTNKLEQTKNENIAIIDRYRRDLATVRVRVPTATCPGGLPDTAASSGVADSIIIAGVSADQNQEAFDRFAAGLAEDAAEHDALIEQCRVVMDWVRGLKK